MTKWYWKQEILAGLRKAGALVKTEDGRLTCAASDLISEVGKKPKEIWIQGLESLISDLGLSAEEGRIMEALGYNAQAGILWEWTRGGSDLVAKMGLKLSHTVAESDKSLEELKRGLQALKQSSKGHRIRREDIPVDDLVKTIRDTGIKERFDFGDWEDAIRNTLNKLMGSGGVRNDAVLAQLKQSGSKGEAEYERLMADIQENVGGVGSQVGGLSQALGGVESQVGGLSQALGGVESQVGGTSLTSSTEYQMGWQVGGTSLTSSTEYQMAVLRELSMAGALVRREDGELTSTAQQLVAAVGNCQERMWAQGLVKLIKQLGLGQLEGPIMNTFLFEDSVPGGTQRELGKGGTYIEEHLKNSVVSARGELLNLIKANPGVPTLDGIVETIRVAGIQNRVEYTEEQVREIVSGIVSKRSQAAVEIAVNKAQGQYLKIGEIKHNILVGKLTESVAGVGSQLGQGGKGGILESGYVHIVGKSADSPGGVELRLGQGGGGDLWDILGPGIQAGAGFLADAAAYACGGPGDMGGVASFVEGATYATYSGPEAGQGGEIGKFDHEGADWDGFFKSVCPPQPLSGAEGGGGGPGDIRGVASFVEGATYPTHPGLYVGPRGEIGGLGDEGVDWDGFFKSVCPPQPLKGAEGGGGGGSG